MAGKTVPSLWGPDELKVLPDDACEHHDLNRGLMTREPVGGGFEHVILLSGAYKCSKSRSDGGSHGIVPLRIWFALVGPKGAVHWLLNTGWKPRSVPESGSLGPYPRAWDIGFHSRTPLHEDVPAGAPCDVLNGVPCYYDGSALNAPQFVPDFLTHPGAVWDALRTEYDRFHGAL